MPRDEEKVGTLGRGFSVIKPRISSKQVGDDWKLAYGLECIRIWKESIAMREAGEDVNPYYPTEEEFREARRTFSKRRL